MAKAAVATKKVAGKGAAAAAAAKAKAAAKKAPKKKEEPAKAVEPEVVEVPQAEEQPEVTMERKALAALFLAAQPEPFPNVAEFTEEQVQAELTENIGLLEEGDKVTVEALPDGPAIWEFLCGMRKDLAGKKVEEQTTGKGKGKSSGKKAEGNKKSNGKAESKKSTSEKSGVTRIESICEAVKIGGTMKEIAEMADKTYSDAGGKSNLAGCLQYANIILSALDNLGFASKSDNGSFALNK